MEKTPVMHGKTNTIRAEQNTLQILGNFMVSMEILVLAIQAYLQLRRGTKE
jgi:hypothetical protein